MSTRATVARKTHFNIEKKHQMRLCIDTSANNFKYKIASAFATNT